MSAKTMYALQVGGILTGVLALAWIAAWQSGWLKAGHDLSQMEPALMGLGLALIVSLRGVAHVDRSLG